MIFCHDYLCDVTLCERDLALNRLWVVGVGGNC